MPRQWETTRNAVRQAPRLGEGGRGVVPRPSYLRSPMSL